MAVETSDANQLAMPTVLVIVHDRSNRLTENICESKRAGFFYSRCAIFFKCISRLKMSPKKKVPLSLEERFYSKSISVDLWLVYKLFSACQWFVTNKQTNTKSISVIYRCFIFFGFGETNHYTLFSHQNFCLICHENRCHWRMSNYILMIRDIIITGLFLITATN